MNFKWRTYEGRIFATVLILFLLEIVTFPIVVYFTYADRSESPCHKITYHDHELNWDKNTYVDSSGTAKLALFDKRYQNAESSDKSDIITPGTSMDPILRLMNSENETIKYTAVLYKFTTADLPVKVSMDGINLTDTDKYKLPEGVKKSNVVRAVTGTVSPYKLQDFDIHWKWDFEKNDYQDMKDTALGNKAAKGAADEVTLGFYLIVETDSGEIYRPQTGDTSFIAGYAVLIAISAVLLILLIADERRRKDE